MRPLLLFLVILASPALCQVERSVPASSALWQEYGQLVQLEKCSGASCKAKRLVLPQTQQGICIKDVLPTIQIANGRSSQWVIEQPLSLVDKNDDTIGTYKIDVLIAVPSGTVQTVCLPKDIHVSGESYIASLAPELMPTADLNHKSSDVRLEPTTDFNGILLTDGRASGNSGFFTITGKGAIDFLFGRSGSSHVRVHVMSQRAGLKLYLGKRLVGNTEMKFSLAEWALYDLFIDKGNKRISVRACNQKIEKDQFDGKTTVRIICAF